MKFPPWKHYKYLSILTTQLNITNPSNSKNRWMNSGAKKNYDSASTPHKTILTLSSLKNFWLHVHSNTYIYTLKVINASRIVCKAFAYRQKLRYSPDTCEVASIASWQIHSKMKTHRSVHAQSPHTDSWVSDQRIH